MATRADMLTRRRMLGIGAGTMATTAGLSHSTLGPEAAMAAGGTDWVLNVEDFGAVGDGVTDDSDAIQAAVFDATGWDPNTKTTDPSRAVYMPPGIYMVGKPIYIPDGLTVWGSGRDVTVLRMLPTCSEPILKAPYIPGYYIGGNDFTLTDVTLDGDAENSESSVNPALLWARRASRWHISRCKFMRGGHYGVSFSSSPAAENGPVDDAYFTDCIFDSNNLIIEGSGGIDTKWTNRLTLDSCLVLNDIVGYDLRSRSGTYINCHARDCWIGMQVRQTINVDDPPTAVVYHTVLGGSSEDCTAGGLVVQQTADQAVDPELVHATIIGFSSRHNKSGLDAAFPGGPPNPDGAIAMSVIGGHYSENSDHGIGLETTREATIQGVICNGNGQSGISLRDTRDVSIVGSKFRNNGQWGIKDRYGDGIDRLSAAGNVFEGHSSGDIENVGTDAKLLANITDASATISAAPTVSLPELAELVVLQGSTGITSISASRNGRRVTLRYASQGSIVSGNNLKLQGEFNADLDDTITLVCHEDTWYEVSRSMN